MQLVRNIDKNLWYSQIFALLLLFFYRENLFDTVIFSVSFLREKVTLWSIRLLLVTHLHVNFRVHQTWPSERSKKQIFRTSLHMHINRNQWIKTSSASILRFKVFLKNSEAWHLVKWVFQVTRAVFFKKATCHKVQTDLNMSKEFHPSPPPHHFSCYYYV